MANGDLSYRFTAITFGWNDPLPANDAVLVSGGTTHHINSMMMHMPKNRPDGAQDLDSVNGVRLPVTMSMNFDNAGGIRITFDCGVFFPTAFSPTIARERLAGIGGKINEGINKALPGLCQQIIEHTKVPISPDRLVRWCVNALANTGLEPEAGKP